MNLTEFGVLVEIKELLEKILKSVDAMHGIICEADYE